MAKIIYTPEELTFRASINAEEAGVVSIKRTKPPKHKSGALVGQVMKDVNGNDVEQFSLEIAEKFDMSSSNVNGVNILELANPLNPSFKRSGGLRNAWQTCSKEWAESVFGCDLTALNALPIDDGTNQARIFIGKMNPSFELNGSTVSLRLQIVAKFASEFKIDSYEVKNLLGERGARATAKRAGDGGRWMMGLNPVTNQPEHIIERAIVNSDMITKDGEIIRKWDHITIAEHTTATTGVPYQLNTATGTVEVANAPLPAL